MKNKLLPLSITFIFIIIFIVFYKGLKDTNIYTPESKINNKVPSLEVKLFGDSKTVNTIEIFQSDKFYLLNIIGMNYKDNKENAKNFLEELGNPYDKIIFDSKGTYAIEWGAYGVPESFLISNNKIIKKYIGPLNKVSVEEIKSIIK